VAIGGVIYVPGNRVQSGLAAVRFIQGATVQIAGFLAFHLYYVVTALPFDSCSLYGHGPWNDLGWASSSMIVMKMKGGVCEMSKAV
jgi:hypothetical protein